MILHGLKQNLFYITSAFLLVLSTNTYAKDWDFKEDKSKSCIVLSPIYAVETQKKIANIGILKLSSQEVDKITESERDLFLNGLIFIVETKDSFKTMKGVGAHVTSKSIDTSLNYRENTTPKNKNTIYTSSNVDTLNMIDALMNNEDLTFEFNTLSSGIEYGLVSAKDFKKNFNGFDTCYKALE